MHRSLVLPLLMAMLPAALAAQSGPAPDSLARAGLALVVDAEQRAASAPRIVVGRVFEDALGLDPGSKALRLLRRALRADPGHPAAAQAIARLALLTRSRDLLDEADLALDAALPRAAADAGLALAAAEVRLALGKAPDAAVLLRDAAPADAAARAVLALATLRSPGRAAEGGELYFIAARDSVTIERWYDELEVLTDGAEQARWGMAVTADARIAWLREFWESRAALAGVTTEARIAEHYGRLELARLGYPRRVRWGAPPDNALVWDRPAYPFDDRGLILIRHGTPERVIRTVAGGGLPDNESWLYHGIDGRPRLYNFLRTGNYNEWLLAWDFPCDPDWRADRWLYEPLVRHCNGQSRVRVRKYSRIALETDSDDPGVAGLPFALGIYRFRGDDGRTEFVAAVALPADSVRGDAIEASFAVVDTAYAGVARAAATVPVRRGTHGETRLALSVTAKPVGGVHRLLLRDPADSTHGAFAGGRVEMLDFRGDTLMISDLVPAAAETATTGALRRAGIALDPMVETEATTGGFRLYYELYNVPRDAIVETTVVVEREDPGLLKRIFGGRARTTLRFRDQASPHGGVLRVLRHVEAGLERGRWRLRVQASIDGRPVERETILTAR